MEFTTDQKNPKIKKVRNIQYVYFVIMTNTATSLQATLTQSQSLTAVQMVKLPITQQI